MEFHPPMRGAILLGQAMLVQNCASTNVGGLVKILSLVDGWFAILESAFGHDLQREHLLHNLPAVGPVWFLTGGLADQILSAFRC